MTRKGALINNFNKVRLAGANYPLRVGKAVHVNRDPACPQTQSTSSRSTGSGSHRIVGRRTLLDAVQG